MKDWTGNKVAIYATHGASNHSKDDRADDDYYATDPKAVEKLLEKEEFAKYIWEPACGGGHISRVLLEHGYDVRSSDIVDRGFEGTEILDFLRAYKNDRRMMIPRDIITNPPYKYAKEFVEKAIDLSSEGVKIAMLLKLTFLEGKARAELFRRYPPLKVYVFSSRINCGKNGDFSSSQSAVAYAWFIWQKGVCNPPVIDWIN